MLKIENVHKKFGRRAVLKGVSFQVEKGEITCLIGVNGIGKTTLLNCILGLVPYHKGAVTLDGAPMTVQSFRKIAYVSDQLAMFKDVTIAQAIAFMQDFYTWDAQKEAYLLTFFKLDKSQYIRDLSKGTVAKVNLLISLCIDVDYLLLDEPFSGIDVFTREQIVSLLLTDFIADKGVLITTHEINEIEQVIDKVIMLDEGKVIKEFYPEEVRALEQKGIVDVMREVLSHETI